MKINATLVKPDGLYGMVMPEKPTKHFSSCLCRYCIDYNRSVQSARDAAIRYEDQELFKELIRVSINKTSSAPGSHEFRSEFEPISGKVYPLPEPLEVETVRQLFNDSETDENEWHWYDEPDDKTYKLYTSYGMAAGRTVLRISQGADRFDKVLANVSEETKAKVDAQFKAIDSAHGYTEGYKIPVSFGQSNEAGVIRRLGACSSERDDNSDVTDRHLSDWVNGGFGRAKNINTEVSESTPLIEKALNDAFVAGKSKQSFESFKKEWYANLRS